MGCASHYQGKELFSDKIKISDEQAELDAAYGIVQNGSKRMEIDWDKDQVTYYQHYYYDTEDAMGDVKNQHMKDADWKGTFSEEGSNKFVAKVEGKYKFSILDVYVQKTKINIEKVSATFTFEKTQKGVSIKNVKVFDNGQPIQSFIKDLQLFKQ